VKTSPWRKALVLRGSRGRVGAGTATLLALLSLHVTCGLAQTRPRARDLGIEIGRLEPGALDAITDVPGVLVGHATLREGDSIRTGVTAIIPHAGDLFRDKVRAAIVVGNGFGKLVGLSQVQELGTIETPILLTGTLSTFRVADFLVDTLLLAPGHGDIISINPVVGETNDGWLSDIRARPVEARHVRAALRSASRGPVEEGAVGAGTGTIALGWKGGIGTASRRLPVDLGGWTVGVLVQTNFGGSLVVDGHPVGRVMRERGISGLHDPSRNPSAARPGAPRDADGGGSVVIVVATDAPLDHRGLERVAWRTFAGVARTGSAFSNGSGDYAIAFTVDSAPPELPDGAGMTALFVATADATEEAILNSLLEAETTVGMHGRTADALPVNVLTEILAH